MAKRRSFKKRLLNSVAVQFILSCIVSFLVRLIYLSNRVSKQFPASVEPYLRGEKPAIFCFWHGRMIMHPFVKPRPREMFVLISRHNDGALITATMRRFGIDSVRGSSGRDSMHAVINLFKVRDKGGNIAITPDGPRGPFQQAAPGAAFVAAKTGYPIIPVTFSASCYWRFHSWDKFMLPKPFGRITFIARGPIDVPDTNAEAQQQATEILQQTLRSITAEADGICGVPA